MSPTSVEMEGTLRPDGTVVLDEPPALSPGRVKVVLQAVSALGTQPAENLLDFVRRVRQESAARGHRFMTDEEVATWVEELRAEDDRIEQAYRQTQGD